MPRFYGTALRGTLDKFVEECLDRPPHEQVSLHEELALARHSALNAISLYSTAVEGGARGEALLTATMLMRESLSYVAEICEKCARVESASRDKVSGMQVSYVVNQVVRIAYESLDRDSAERLERGIRERVKIQSMGLDGTTLTPDQDVAAMDATVPREEL